MNMELTDQWKVQNVTYEECCDICRELVIDIDNRRWIVGDYALHIDTHYGQHTMEDFARDIGMNRSTVSNWKRVSEFYPNPFRAEQIERNPNLTYTYFRDALRLGDDKQIIADWLEEVSYNGWSADEASHKLTERLGRQTRDSIEGEVSGHTWSNGKFCLIVRLDTEDMQKEWQGKQVTIRAK